MVSLFCAPQGRERRLLAGRRWRAATAVAYPQEGESLRACQIKETTVCGLFILCPAGARKAALGGAPVARRNRCGLPAGRRVPSGVPKQKAPSARMVLFCAEAQIAERPQREPLRPFCFEGGYGAVRWKQETPGHRGARRRWRRHLAPERPNAGNCPAPEMRCAVGSRKTADLDPLPLKRARCGRQGS